MSSTELFASAVLRLSFVLHLSLSEQQLWGPAAVPGLGALSGRGFTPCAELEISPWDWGEASPSLPKRAPGATAGRGGLPGHGPGGVTGRRASFGSVGGGEGLGKRVRHDGIKRAMGPAAAELVGGP